MQKMYNNSEVDKIWQPLMVPNMIVQNRMTHILFAPTCLNTFAVIFTINKIFFSSNRRHAQ